MLLAAVLSDTHVTAAEVGPLMERIGPHLRGVDRILHAGDVVCSELLDALEQVAPVDAVAGNMDGPSLQARLPEYSTLDLDGRRVGLLHGWGAPGDLPRRVFARCCDASGQPTVDALVFGHSHSALVEYRQGVLLVNPGSPTDRRWAPFCSLALVQVGRTLSARIVRLD